MRTYVGDRRGGRPRVWIVDRPEEVSISEVSAYLAQTRRLMAERPGGGEPDHVDHVARKLDVIARTERAGEDRRALVHRGTRSPDGFEWGYVGTGPSDLAHELLRQHLGLDVTTPVRAQFRDDVVVRLDREHFELPASEISAWVTANRALVEQQLFFEPAPRTDLPALAVTDALSIEVTHQNERVQGEATASTLVAACEAAWSDIRTHHAELPEAIMVLGTGVERGKLVKLGHWWGGQWVVDGQPRGEVLLAGEALHLPPRQVFEILLHEAAHGINAARGVKDTSRGGRYHNGRFASTAQEVLLEVEAMPPYGMAATALSPAAADRYAESIDRLGDAMRLARQLDRRTRLGADEEVGVEGQLGGGAGRTDGAGNGGRSAATAAACGCGRRMRMAPKVLAVGPVVCGVCGSEFASGAEQRRAATPEEPSDAVVERSFLARRAAALTGEAQPPPDVPVGGASGIEVDRIRQRIDAAVALTILDHPEAFRPLLERAERLAQLSSGADRAQGTTLPTPDQRQGVTEVGDVAATADDRASLRDWYERFGTPDEEPMRASDPTEANRRVRLARGLLKADGSVHGPAVTVGPSELAAGDRIVSTVEDPVRDLPAGVPGTIERVDPEAGTVKVDFATWGRLEVAIDDLITRGLRHDYVDPSPCQTTGRVPPEIELGRAGPGVEL